MYTTKFDLLIVNKGLSGLVLACGLSKYFNVAIIDRNLNVDIVQTNKYNSRLISFMNIVSINLLRNLNIWSSDIEYIFNSIYQLEIIKKGKNIDNSNRFLFESGYLGYSELGRIVDYNILYALIFKHAKKNKNITFLNNGVSLRSISYKAHEALVILNNDFTCIVKLIIGADGVNSQIRNNENIPIIFRDIGYYGLSAVIHIEKKHYNILRCIIHNDGTMIILPLQDLNLACIFWLLPMCKIEKYLYDTSKHEYNLNKDLMQFNQLFGWSTLHKDSNCINVICLRMYNARSFIKNRLILLGESAYSICPWIFQTINIDIMEANILCNYLIQLKMSNKDIGYYYYLRSYNNQQRLRLIKLLMQNLYILSNYFYKDYFTKYMQFFIFYLIKIFPGYKKYILQRIMGLHDESFFNY